MMGSKKDEKRAPKKGKMKQKIFPRHFYPVLRIKFFNPEKCSPLVQIRNVEKQPQQQCRVESTENEMKTVVLLSVESDFSLLLG